MHFGVPSGKNVFLKEFDHGENEDQCAQQTQEQYIGTPVGNELTQQKIF
jgi:hypothetical protein